MYAIAYAYQMKTLSSTELRATLSAVMDQVNDDHEPVIVTRAKGKPDTSKNPELSVFEARCAVVVGMFRGLSALPGLSKGVVRA